MGMGKRKRSKQDSLFIPTASLARSSSHDFYERLNQVLSADGFDDFVEDLCEPFYVQGKGRPRIPPGTYFACCWSASLRARTRSVASTGECRIDGPASLPGL